MRQITRRMLALAVCLASTAPLMASGWCDLPFKDVAEYADAVVLARYEVSDAAVVRLAVVEVIRGSLGISTVVMDPTDLDLYRPRDGMGFLVALDRDGRPVRTLAEIGVCTPVSLLPLHRGKLRSRFREGYDGRSRPISLDSLRSELAALSRSDGVDTVASGY